MLGALRVIPEHWPSNHRGIERDLDVLLTIGRDRGAHLAIFSTRPSPTASSRRPSQVCERVAAELIEGEIDESWLVGVDSVGVTSGASPPEFLARRVATWFAQRGVEEIDAHPGLLEDVSFRLPAEVR